MKRRGIKGILLSALVLVMSFGFCITSFADDDIDNVNAAIAEVVLSNGVKVELPDKYKSQVRSHLKQNRENFDSDDVDRAVAKIEEIKNIIRESGVASKQELKDRFNNDRSFAGSINNRAHSAAEDLACENFWLTVDAEGNIVQTDRDEYEYDEEKAARDNINAAVEYVELKNGVRVKISNTASVDIKQWLDHNQDKYSVEDARNTLDKIDEFKEVIRNSNAVSAEDLRSKFNDETFLENLQTALDGVTDTIHADRYQLYVDDEGSLRYRKVGDDSEEDAASDSETDEQAGTLIPANQTPVTPVIVAPAPVTQVAAPTPSNNINIAIKTPDGAVTNLNEPIIKTTGYNFAAVALVIGAAVLLVAGCVIIARRKKLFS